MSVEKDQMKSGLTIALLGSYFGWSGGIELLRILANALALKAKTENISLYLLLPVENKFGSVRDFLDFAKKLAYDLVDRKFSSYKIRHAYEPSMLDYFKNLDGRIHIVHYSNRPGGLNRCLKNIEADVALPALGTLGENFPVPWIGYITDFQHKYFAHFFNGTDCLNRDIQFASILRDAKAAIVNSKTVKADIEKFYPYNECKVFNLPFAPSPVRVWLDQEGVDVHAKYSLPERYFLISNQFWLHKGHQTAFEALSKLHSGDIHIVCTGKSEDYRAPGYFATLGRLVENLSLGKRVHFLGHIPKIDQIRVMKKAIGLVQPTLFEGGPGGGSVYDAISIGVPCIVSDIEINREIDSDDVIFFEAGSSSDLCEKMTQMLSKNRQEIDVEELYERGERRKKVLAEELIKAIQFVIKPAP